MSISLSPNPWFVISKPRPRARLRLFCFPYSGAGANIFFQWPGILPPSLEVCAVQYPGRGTRMSEPPITRMPDLIDALAPLFPDFFGKPFAFFGHSLGAVAAFELARRLRSDYGMLPVHLIVSGHSAPQIPDRRPPIHALPDEAFIAELRKLNGTPEDILQNKELVALLIPILRADFELSETYVYQPEAPLDTPLAAFGGLNDPFINRAELEAWQEHTTRIFRLRMFPGDHFYLNTNRSLLLQALARELALYLN